jgi:hypothetical protein
LLQILANNLKKKKINKKKIKNKAEKKYFEFTTYKYEINQQVNISFKNTGKKYHCCF